jgi:hypothetical protein
MDTTTKAEGRGAPVRLLAWGAAAALFLLPLAAMQFTSNVNWTTTDFLVWGGLIGVTGALIELAVRVLRTPLYRFIAVAAILAFALLVWADVAVGVF